MVPASYKQQLDWREPGKNFTQVHALQQPLIPGNSLRYLFNVTPVTGELL